MYRVFKPLAAESTPARPGCGRRWVGAGAGGGCVDADVVDVGASVAGALLRVAAGSEACSCWCRGPGAEGKRAEGSQTTSDLLPWLGGFGGSGVGSRPGRSLGDCASGSGGWPGATASIFRSVLRTPCSVLDIIHCAEGSRALGRRLGCFSSTRQESEPGAGSVARGAPTRVAMLDVLFSGWSDKLAIFAVFVLLVSP